VVLTPRLAGDGASIDTTVESGPTSRLWMGLLDPATIPSAAASKTASSCAVDAANEVWQVTVTVWPVGRTATSEHPTIGTPPSSKTIVPDGVVETSVEVTVAIIVTGSLVRAGSGDTSRDVELGNRGGRAVPEATTAVGALPLAAADAQGATSHNVETVATSIDRMRSAAGWGALRRHQEPGSPRC
jgi:hypothetical protein